MREFIIECSFCVQTFGVEGPFTPIGCPLWVCGQESIEIKSSRWVDRPCIEKGCEEMIAGSEDPIPGTGRKGSAYWCVKHESERILRISKQLEDLVMGR